MKKLVGRTVKTPSGVATVISQIGRYYTIEYDNGDLGWVTESQFELMPDDQL